MAYGAPFPPDLPVVSAGAGMKTPFGITLLPPGSRIAAYVRSTGAQSGDDNFTTLNLVPTLAAGLARARAGLGDTVVVMPGHSESVVDATMLNNLVAGTRIVGFGRGSNMPTFRWTATASQWILNDADVTIQGLRLRLEGANGVVKAIVTTAADIGIYGCDIEVASGASNKATIALEVGAASHRFELIGNVFRGTATHNATNGVLLAGVSDQVRITDNEMVFSATAANGLINVTAAVTSLKVLRNVLSNTMTSSTSCITVAAATAASGVFADNYCAILADGTANATGILFPGSPSATIKCFQNFCSDEPRESGVLSPAAVGT
jgi:hypothetical protein